MTKWRLGDRTTGEATGGGGGRGGALVGAPVLRNVNRGTRGIRNPRACGRGACTVVSTDPGAAVSGRDVEDTSPDSAVFTAGRTSDAGPGRPNVVSTITGRVRVSGGKDDGRPDKAPATAPAPDSGTNDASPVVASTTGRERLSGTDDGRPGKTSTTGRARVSGTDDKSPGGVSAARPDGALGNDDVSTTGNPVPSLCVVSTTGPGLNSVPVGKRSDGVPTTNPEGDFGPF